MTPGPSYWLSGRSGFLQRSSRKAQSPYLMNGLLIGASLLMGGAKKEKEKRRRFAARWVYSISQVP